MADFKMDPFTRTVAKGMQDFGFKFKKKKSKGNHRRLEYKGQKAKRTLKYSLQSKAKEASRGGIIQGLRKELISGGVAEKDRLWLDRIALGLIAIEKNDDKDDLERKLFDAIDSVSALEAAKLAFALGRIAGQDGTTDDSSAITKRQIDFDEKFKKQQLSNKIEKYCFRRFIGIMNEKLEEVTCIDFDLSHTYQTNTPTFSKTLTNIYGLNPILFSYNDDEDYITVHGEFTGKIAQILKKHGLANRFSALTDTLDSGLFFHMQSTKMFDYFSMPATYYMTIEAGEEILNEIEKTQANVEMRIKP